MGINFPNTPSIGTTWPSPPVAGQPVYTWDGEKWGSGSGYGAIYMSDTPPAAPAGSLWYETDTGLLYARVWDGDSLQWVQVLSGPPDAVLFNTVQALSETQKVTARKNVYAAPFDAMAYSGMQVNGSMEVSQELGNTGRPTSGFVCDSWQISYSGTMAPYVAVVPSGTAFNGIPGYLQMTVNTAQSSLGASDYVQIFQSIEGNRVAKLLYGTGIAQPITIGFWTSHFRPGIYSVSVRNAAFDRSYVTTYTHNVSNVAQYNTITIPGDVGGTWLKDHQAGLRISFGVAASTTYTTTPNVWTAGNFFAATGQVNGIGAISDVFRITGVIILPGTEAPIASRAAYVMRSWDQELLICQRYYCKSFYVSTNPVNATPGDAPTYAGVTTSAVSILSQRIYYPTRMRIQPTLLFYSPPTGTPSNGMWQFFSSGSVFSNAVTAGYQVNDIGFAAQLTISSGTFGVGFFLDGHWTADARI